MQLAAAALMTADGAGLWLAASPGTGGRAVAAGCAFLLAARLAAGPLARRRQQPAVGGAPGWVAAAAVHQRSLPARVPAATLAAAARYLPALAASRGARAMT